MHRSKLLPTLPVVALLFLPGCAATVSDGGQCPSLVAYDKAFNNQLADELDGMPEGSVIPRVVEDYIALRDMVRKCR
jgi:hypothetical protein